jgi:hypothetical protein
MLAIAATAALLFSSSAAASPRPFAAEPTAPHFIGKVLALQAATTPTVPPTGNSGGGSIPGDLGLAGQDLMTGAPPSDAFLNLQITSKRPFTTDEFVSRLAGAASIPFLTDLRASIVRVARAYLNAPTLENKGNNNHGLLVCSLGGKEYCGVAWCALFASSMWRIAGVRAMPVTPPVAGIVAWGVRHKRWKNSKFMPSAGDIVAYGCSSRDFCQHTGLVVSATARTITTIEGNTSSSISGREGVGQHVRSRDGWISGFVSLS